MVTDGVVTVATTTLNAVDAPVPASVSEFGALTFKLRPSSGRLSITVDDSVGTAPGLGPPLQRFAVNPFPPLPPTVAVSVDGGVTVLPSCPRLPLADPRCSNSLRLLLLNRCGAVVYTGATVSSERLGNFSLTVKAGVPTSPAAVVVLAGVALNVTQLAGSSIRPLGLLLGAGPVFNASWVLPGDVASSPQASFVLMGVRTDGVNGVADASWDARSFRNASAVVTSYYGGLTGLVRRDFAFAGKLTPNSGTATHTVSFFATAGLG